MWFREFQQDIESVFERDPAARTKLEVILCYPGLHAIWGYRFSSWMWKHQMKLVSRLFSHLVRLLTGIEIHPGAKIGERLFIDHGMGVVIGETAEIGDGVTLYHGVTLGGASLNKGKRHPTLGDNIVVGAGAKILGPITVGDNSRIGANAVVVKPVPNDAVVVGVPGQVITRSQPRQFPNLPDLDHGRLPDLVGETLTTLVEHVRYLEARINGQEKHVPELHMPDHGVWHGEDFMI